MANLNKVLLLGNVTRDPRVIEAYLGPKFAAQYASVAP